MCGGRPVTCITAVAFTNFYFFVAKHFICCANANQSPWLRAVAVGGGLLFLFLVSVGRAREW